jgi:hypothetical protein
MAKKDVFMEGPGWQVFTAYRLYYCCGFDPDYGYCVPDDKGEEHYIGVPGQDFYEECFCRFYCLQAAGGGR